MRAHEEVQFRLVSRRNTMTMTSRLSVVNVSLTEADNSYARRELLSDRSFDVTSTRILNQTRDEEDTEWRLIRLALRMTSWWVNNVAGYVNGFLQRTHILMLCLMV